MSFGSINAGIGFRFRILRKAILHYTRSIHGSSRFHGQFANGYIALNYRSGPQRERSRNLKIALKPAFDISIFTGKVTYNDA
jgi:hypothetical protein